MLLVVPAVLDGFFGCCDRPLTGSLFFSLFSFLFLFLFIFLRLEKKEETIRRRVYVVPCWLCYWRRVRLLCRSEVMGSLARGEAFYSVDEA